MLSASLLITVVSAKDKSHAILAHQNTQYVIQVTLVAEDTPTSNPTVRVLTVSDELEKETDVVPIYSQGNDYSTFSILVPKYDPNLEESYKVEVTFDEIKDNFTYRRRVTLSVSALIDFTIERRFSGANECDSRDFLLMNLRKPDMNWQNIYRWLDKYIESGRSIAKLTVKRRDEYDVHYHLFIRSRRDAAMKLMGVCLVPDNVLPNEKFDAVVDFAQNDLPEDVKKSITAKKISGNEAIAFPEDTERDPPEKRKLDKTVDFGVAFTSGVTDEDVAATDTTPATINRHRNNVGVFDLDFQYPNIIKQEYKHDKWLTFFTPIYVKASVSTEPITKDTLAQNRILFGFEGESRYVTSGTGWSVGSHRIEWGVTHASDRDFKQKEIYASVLYQPVLEGLHKPFALNYHIEKDDKEKTERKKFAGYGYTIQPSVGFDFGRTYSRRRPAAAIEPSPLIRRFNFGLKLGLDITKFISLTAEDVFYLRGEDTNHLQRNWFKTVGEFKLFRTNQDRAAHSFFITYEKGWQPPFTGAQTNSFRVGYRIVADFCGLFCR